ncbi:hypothetical protein EMCG_00602 [[Emmonsia] crescens]|uniref:Uncharacterized protein n=1 Tax=[Emmonsia] crescens TaxID=73230 RepID=A0A0G2HU01_9EURO|nr:hypothetical protein EMCG_00602 [Emmonsia crescens UAMH 3008]
MSPALPNQSSSSLPNNGNININPENNSYASYEDGQQDCIASQDLFLPNILERANASRNSFGISFEGYQHLEQHGTPGLTTTGQRTITIPSPTQQQQPGANQSPPTPVDQTPSARSRAPFILTPEDRGACGHKKPSNLGSSRIRGAYIAVVRPITLETPRTPPPRPRIRAVFVLREQPTFTGTAPKFGQDYHGRAAPVT